MATCVCVCPGLDQNYSAREQWAPGLVFWHPRIGRMFQVYTGADQVGEIERISAHEIGVEEFQAKYINR